MSTSDNEKNKQNTRLIAEMIHNELSQAILTTAADEEETYQTMPQSDFEAQSPSTFESYRHTKSLLPTQKNKRGQLGAMQAIPEQNEDSGDEEGHFQMYKKSKLRASSDKQVKSSREKFNEYLKSRKLLNKNSDINDNSNLQ